MVELWSGHIEDSVYVERSKILEEQSDFAMNDPVNNLLVEFIDIFDKGYRCIVWQPCYSRRAEVVTALLCSKRSNIQ